MSDIALVAARNRSRRLVKLARPVAAAARTQLRERVLVRTGPIVGDAAKVLPEVGTLELGAVGAQRVHVLLGRVVRPGDEVELLLNAGIWLRGRYDWSGIEARWPALRVELGGPWETQRDAWRPAAVMALHPDAILRWAR